MLKILLLINILLFSQLKSEPCVSLQEMEESFSDYLQKKSLQNLILSGKIIKSNTKTQIRSFLLMGKEYYALSTDFEIEKYESLQLLENFKKEKIKNFYTNLISCAINNDTIIIIFENFGKKIKNSEISNYFMEDLNFRNRLDIYKHAFEVIAELEDNDLVAENFDFLQNYLNYRNEKVDFVADLIFNIFETEKTDVEKLTKTSAPEEREDNIIQKGTNSFQTLLGILFLEFTETKIIQEYPDFQNWLNENNKTENLQKIKETFQELIYKQKRFKIKKTGNFTKFLYWYWSFFGFFKVKRIYTFENLLDQIFIMNPYYRLSSNNIVKVLENLKDRLFYEEEENINEENIL